MTSKSKNHYETLGVPETATTKEIKDAFISQSKSCHPDKHPSGHSKFVKISEAYNILSNPQRRKEYNMQLVYDREYRPNHWRVQTNTPPGRWRQYEEWEMRDKSRPHVEEDFYYGIKGIKRVSNGWIAVGAVGFMLAGMVLHYIAARITVSKLREEHGSYEVSDRRVVHRLLQARHVAQINANQAKLKEAMNEKENDPGKDSELLIP